MIIRPLFILNFPGTGRSVAILYSVQCRVKKKHKKCAFTHGVCLLFQLFWLKSVCWLCLWKNMAELTHLFSNTCRRSSSWRILILSLSIWILWSLSFCCCCCWVVSALGILNNPAWGFWVGWFCWEMAVLDVSCCWCWWFITMGKKRTVTVSYCIVSSCIWILL